VFNTTVSELCLDFMKYAEEFYRDEAGEPTGEANNYKYALRPLVALFRNVRCCQFGTSKLFVVRDELVKVHVRKQVNIHLARIKRMFKWGVSQEMLPVSTYLCIANRRRSQAVLPTGMVQIGGLYSLQTCR